MSAPSHKCNTDDEQCKTTYNHFPKSANIIQYWSICLDDHVYDDCKWTKYLDNWIINSKFYDTRCPVNDIDSCPVSVCLLAYLIHTFRFFQLFWHCNHDIYVPYFEICKNFLWNQLHANLMPAHRANNPPYICLPNPSRNCAHNVMVS